MADETKAHILNALGFLNDKTVIPDAFKVVLLTYLLMECCPQLLQGSGGSGGTASGSSDAVMEWFAPLWAGLEEEPRLLEAFQMELLVNGTEVRSLPGVTPKQVGKILLYAREQMVLNPSITREALLRDIQSQFSGSSA